MIAGLSVGAWLLLAASVGVGLGIEVAFYAAQRRRDRRPGAGDG